MRVLLKSMRLFAVLAFVAVSATAGAQSFYPDRPVRLIVPFPPGGNVDISARIIGQFLSEELGQPFVIENRAGAAGFVGADHVVRSKPDGYTLLVSSNSAISIGPLLNPNAPYEPLRDFTPITMLAQTPLVIVVHPQVPASNVAELIAFAKARPGTALLATPSAGSINHMAIAQFEIATGTRFNLVHYKGNAPAIADLMGGHAQVSFDQITSSLPHVRSGKLRALAVTSAARVPDLPEVPTLSEAGFPGLEAVTFTALLGPRDLPVEIVNRLNLATNKALKTPAVAERFAAAGARVNGMSPEQIGAFLRSEQARWGTVIKTANIKAE